MLASHLRISIGSSSTGVVCLLCVSPRGYVHVSFGSLHKGWEPLLRGKYWAGSEVNRTPAGIFIRHIINSLMKLTIYLY